MLAHTWARKAFDKQEMQCCTMVMDRLMCTLVKRHQKSHLRVSPQSSTVETIEPDVVIPNSPLVARAELAKMNLLPGMDHLKSDECPRHI